jgi:O-antigen/teichoic acid export membrane protein
MLQGCGQIAAVNGFRLAETVVRAVVLWVAMASGAALWSSVVALAASVALGIAFVLARYAGFFSSLATAKPTGAFDWRREVAPMQWRVALSWICGYFVFYLFTPAAFYFLGAKEAGQMGITWALVAGLSGVAATWLQVRTPAFAGLVARNDFEGLDALARRTACTGILVGAFLGGCGLACLAVLDAYRPDIAGRFLPIGAVAVFLLAECLHQLSAVQSTYLRAFKREPFLGISVGTAIIVSLGTLVLTPALGVSGPGLSYLLGVLAALTGGTLVFLRNRREWTFPREAGTDDGTRRG